MSHAEPFDGRTLTLLEYETFDEADDERIELMRGRAVREPLPGGLHGVILLRLVHALHSYVSARTLGQVLMETGVRYPGEPPTVRRPDVGFIVGQRLPSTIPTSFWQTVPDLVIEIVSPNDRWSVVQQKLDADLAPAYARSGSSIRAHVPSLYTPAPAHPAFCTSTTCSMPATSSRDSLCPSPTCSPESEHHHFAVISAGRSAQSPVRP